MMYTAPVFPKQYTQIPVYPLRVLLIGHCEVALLNAGVLVKAVG